MPNMVVDGADSGSFCSSRIWAPGSYLVDIELVSMPKYFSVVFQAKCPTAKVWLREAAGQLFYA